MHKRNELVLANSVVTTKNVKKHASTQKNKEFRSLLRNLSKYAQGIHNSHDYNHRYLCVQNIRKVLSFDDRKPPIQSVINCGVLPQLIKLLHFNAAPKIQFESLWILTNIASGNTQQTRILVKLNVVSSLKRVLKSNKTNNEIKNQAMWCLGNIAGDCSFLRNVLFIKYDIFHDIIVPIFTFESESNIITIDSNKMDKHKLDLMRNTAWTLCNFCRKASKKLFFENRVMIIKIFKRLLQSNDIDVLSDICWAINYFVENRNDKRCHLIVNEIINNGMIEKMIRLLFLQNDENKKVYFGAIRVIGYIISIEKSDTNKWTLKLIELGMLENFVKILRNSDNKNNLIKRQQKECLWMISNMVANSDRIKQIIHALNDHKLLISIIGILQVSPFMIRREAAYIIMNIIINSNTLKDIEYFYKSPSIICTLFSLFRCNDIDGFSNKFGVCILESIQHLLELDRKHNNYKYLYHALKCSGIEILESVQNNIKKDEYYLIFNQKMDKIIKLLQEEQNEGVLFVKCCSEKCNKTKYVQCFLNEDQDGTESSISSTSSISRVKKNKFYRCKQCNSSVYCSKKCQKWHWKNGHRYKCSTLYNN